MNSLYIWCLNMRFHTLKMIHTATFPHNICAFEKIQICLLYLVLCSKSHHVCWNKMFLSLLLYHSIFTHPPPHTHIHNYQQFDLSVYEGNLHVIRVHLLIAGR